jgi:hypothetical protein
MSKGSVIMGLRFDPSRLKSPFEAKDLPSQGTLIGLKVGQLVQMIQPKAVPITYIGYHAITADFSWGMDTVYIPVFQDAEGMKWYGPEISWS